MTWNDASVELKQASINLILGQYSISIPPKPTFSGWIEMRYWTEMG